MRSLDRLRQSYDEDSQVVIQDKRSPPRMLFSDTEVLLALYEEMGPGCVEKFNGDFAFAVWDTRLRRLMLARDRMGVRPLYYARAGGSLLFASEVSTTCPRVSTATRTTWFPAASEGGRTRDTATLSSFATSVSPWART